MVEKLLQYMRKEGLDGFFVSSGINVRYISHYTGDDSYLLITVNTQYFLTDSRYTEQAEMECPGYQVIDWRAAPGKSLGSVLENLSEKEGLKRIGFEAEDVSYQLYSTLKNSMKAELAASSGTVEQMRIIKTPEEIQYLKNACAISCRAFDRLLHDIRPGVTEKELAARLSLYMVMEGADPMPYGNILISGARTSLLHGLPSSKAIEYGDFELIEL